MRVMRSDLSARSRPHGDARWASLVRDVVVDEVTVHGDPQGRDAAACCAFGARHNGWAVAFRQTLTFLFTDVEASTRRWAADRERMSRELAADDEIMRDLRVGATTRRTVRARRV